MGRRKRQLTAVEEEFVAYLRQAGRSGSLKNDLGIVRRFLRHIGDRRIDLVGEAAVRAFFNGCTDTTRRQRAIVVSQFLKFSMASLPVPVTARGEQISRAVTPGKKEIALRQKWNVDKLREQKVSDDDLIAKLARKVIDFYMYAEKRIKGEPEDLDELYRFADECRELIQNNLTLFMSMSAQGRNIHSKIDERVQ